MYHHYDARFIAGSLTGERVSCPPENYPLHDLNSVAKSNKIKSQNGGKAGRKGLATDTFCAWDGDILVLNILGTPGAKQDVIGKPKGHQLKISVTAAPEGGRATDYMVKFLAKEFGVAVNDIEVVFGRFNVNKQLRIKSPKQLPSVISKHLSQEPAG